jgi:DNA-binding MarR family transcriptional regulator
VKTDRSLAAYRSLAEFRYQIRRFLRYSEDAARECGIEPQQHQLLLGIKGLPKDKHPTIGELADRLQIKPHSAVELVNRLTEHGFVTREIGKKDRRAVLIRLTPAGEQVLHALSMEHQTELTKTGPQLMHALNEAMKLAGKGRK